MDDEVVVPGEDEGPDADFDAGFEQEVTQPTTTPAAADSTDLTDEDPAAAVAAAEVAAQPSLEEQVTSLMKQVEEGNTFRSDAARKFDNAFGQLGGMKQALERIQSATPTGQKVEITDQDFAELRTEFPELAALQIKGLQNVLSRMQGTGQAASSPDVAALVQTQVAAVLHQRDIEALDEVVPDWNKEVKTPAFKQWFDGQPEAVKALGASEAPKDAKRMLTLYSNRPKPKPQVSTRQRQLEAAAAPHTSRGAAAQDAAVDDFDVGFNTPH